MGNLTTSSVAVGPDRRLTVLVLGSDYRPTQSGDRTDVIMVVSVNANPDSSTYRQISAVSIPRDIVYFPKAAVNGGGSHRYVSFAVSSYKKAGCGAACVDTNAMRKFKADVAYALGIQIDYYAYLRFTGFNALIDHIGGVNVHLDPAKYPYGIRDSYFWHNPRLRGVMFPKGWNNRLDGHTLCGGLRIACKNALVYVRSRKGPNNSDYARARRQQDVIVATAKKVVARGSASLGALITAVSAPVTKTGLATDMPRSLADAQYLYGLADGATMPNGKRTVLGPSAYAARVGTSYQYKLKLSAVRTLCDSLFGNV